MPRHSGPILPPLAGGPTGPVLPPLASGGAGYGPAQESGDRQILSNVSTDPTLARGFKYPFQIVNGRVALSEGDQHIRESMMQIMLTAPGEYLFLPEFGCDINHRVFAPVNVAGLARYDIQVALRKWEPRIEVLDISAQLDQGHLGVVKLLVEYRVRGQLNTASLATEIRRSA